MPKPLSERLIEKTKPVRCTVSFKDLRAKLPRRERDKYTDQDLMYCREWTGGRSGSGYPVIEHSGKRCSVHDEVFKLAKRKRRKNTYLKSNCGNKLCCESGHLVAEVRPSYLNPRHGQRKNPKYFWFIRLMKYARPRNRHLAIKKYGCEIRLCKEWYGNAEAFCTETPNYPGRGYIPKFDPSIEISKDNFEWTEGQRLRASESYKSNLFYVGIWLDNFIGWRIRNFIDQDDLGFIDHVLEARHSGVPTKRKDLYQLKILHTKYSEREKQMYQEMRTHSSPSANRNRFNELQELEKRIKARNESAKKKFDLLRESTLKIFLRGSTIENFVCHRKQI
jgi:hypothetical protein